MKFGKIGLKISKETKETLLGGVAGALAVNMESAANGLVVGYPQILKDRLLNEIPRNGELLATIAPVGITWAIAKKKHSSRVHNVRNGVMFYDLPKLMGLVAYRVAYTMGLPQAGLQAQRINGMRLNIRPTTMNRQMNRAVNMSTGGKYVMKTNSAPQMGGGIGKYR